jgi:uncharacterized damage-inducible protein DinB
MSIADSLLPEFDHEMGVTRTLLEIVPEAKASWKPHQKSFSLGDLSAHLANIPTWAGVTLSGTEFDVNPPGGAADHTPRTFGSAKDNVKTFDDNVKAAREAIAKASDADFMTMWTLKNGGKETMSMPRVGVVRSFVLNHLIHHRGQLSVYLRLQDVPLPGIYGPSADTPM